jgi:hypothetical protein
LRERERERERKREREGEREREREREREEAERNVIRAVNRTPRLVDIGIGASNAPIGGGAKTVYLFSSIWE